MNNKTKILLPIYLAIAVVLGIFIGTTLDYKKETVLLFGGNSQEKKIKRLIDFIQYDYVDDVDTDSLLDNTIMDMLGKLDPHSTYIPPQDLQSITETMEGKFVGIGVQFNMLNDSLTVIKVLKNGPSERAGLKAGDRILTANNDTLYGKKLNNSYIIKTLKGEPDSKVDITVYRKMENQELPFTIIRGDVPIESVDASYMINDELGYIKINKFAASTYDEFKDALDGLQEQGMKELVLDLRQNPGGFLQVATKIIDEFLEDGKLIVFTKNKREKVDKTFATAKGDFENGQVYVLIDGASASASEIVAGALQDNDKGTIVGRRSFGKGLVQQEMELGDGSAVRLTVSRYYTPTGRSIQKPYTDDIEDYYVEYENRYNEGELLNRDSIKVNDTLKYVTPKGKVVYGGGGIIPDVFVPLDTTQYIDRVHYSRLNTFVFDYIDNHREKFEGITFDEFDKNFDLDQKIYAEYTEGLKDSFHYKDLKADENMVRLYLKALFAQQLFDSNAFYKLMNREDEMLKKVMDLEKNGIPINQ